MNTFFVKSLSSLFSYVCFFTYCTTALAIETTSRISESSAGVEANNTSTNPAISSDGKFVTFDSRATNLVGNDNNSRSDIFIYDIAANNIELVSVNVNGESANNDSTLSDVSSDGRFVAFQSIASDLISNDSNGFFDVFVADRVNGTIERVSVDSSGMQANGHSLAPRISGNGRYVVFYSTASNLVSGDSNRQADIFLHDRNTGITERISVSSSGVEADRASMFPSVSDDGNFVVFLSSATNLVPNDINNFQDVFLFDRTQNIVERINISNTGMQSNDWSGAASISGNGQFIAFDSLASNLVANDNNNTDDIFVFDRNSGVLTRISVNESGIEGNGYSNQPSISDDGNFITYFSFASNMVVNDTNGVEDILMHDMTTGSTTIISLTSNGGFSNDASYLSAVSTNGQLIAFSSFATNLVSNDTNGVEDIFLRDRGASNQPPVANAGGDRSMYLGQRIFLDGSQSFDPEGQAITQYMWQLVSAPEGSTPKLFYTDTATALFYPDMIGNYVISLTVVDGESFSTADEVIISVSQNLPPVAIATADVTSGFAPLVVQFDANQSTDPEASALFFNWDFGDDSGSNLVNPVHTYTQVGVYSVTLTVRDGAGNTDQFMLEITVNGINQKPVVEIIALSPTSGTAPLTVSLAARLLDPDGDTLSTHWDMGDDTILDGTEVTHTYTRAGEYVVTLTVSDGEFQVSDDITITVGSGIKLDVSSAKVKTLGHRNKFHNILMKMNVEGNLLLDTGSAISITADEVELFSALLSEFREVRSNVFLYHAKHIFVRINTNTGSIKILRNKINMGDAVDDDRLNVTVTLGSQTATDNIELTRHDHRHYQNNSKSHDKCDATHTYK